MLNCDGCAYTQLAPRRAEVGVPIRGSARAFWIVQLTCHHRLESPEAAPPPFSAPFDVPPLRVTRATPPRLDILTRIASSCAMDHAVRTTILAFVNQQDGNTAAPNEAAPLRFMTGAQYAANVAARRASTGSPRPSGHFFPAARPFLNPSSAAFPAATSGASYRAPIHVGGFSQVGTQAPTMTAAARSGITSGTFAATPPGVAVASGSCAPGPSGAPSLRPSAVATAAPVRAPGALMRASDYVAPFSGLSDLRSFAHRGPGDDADDEDVDDGLYDEGDDNHTPFAGPDTTLPRPMAGPSSTLPINKKRRGRTGARSSPPSPTAPRRGGPPISRGIGTGCLAQSTGAGDRGTMTGVTGTGASPSGGGHNGRTAGGAQDSGVTGSATPRTRRGFTGSSTAMPPPGPACTAVAAATAGGPQASLPTASQVTDLTRAVSAGFAGVRREVTAQRKELAILNSQMRAVTKKVDAVAVLADRLTASLFYQRRAVINMAGDVSMVLARTVVRSTGAMAAGAGPSSAGVLDADGNAVNTAVTTMEAEVQEAQWILELKVCPHYSPTVSWIARAGVPALAPVSHTSRA